MAERVVIQGASDAAAARQLASSHERRSPEGSSGWTPSMQTNPNAISGRVDEHSGEVDALRDPIDGTTQRHVVQEDPFDGQLRIGNMRVDRQMAVDQGLVEISDDGTVIAKDGSVVEAIEDAQLREDDQRLQADEISAMLQDHSDNIDRAEEMMGAEGVAKLCEAIIEGSDERALEMVPDSSIDATYHNCARVAEELGMPFEGLEHMSHLLSEESRQSALRAAITGNNEKFRFHVRETMTALEANTVGSKEFMASVAELGQVQGFGRNAVVVTEEGAFNIFEMALNNQFTWE